MRTTRFFMLIFVFICSTTSAQNLFSKKFDQLGSSAHFTQLTNGSYLMSATRRVSGDTWELIVLRTDAEGRPIWKKNFRSAGFTYHTVNSITATKDGGAILVGDYGFNDADVLAMKLTKDGKLAWTKTYGTTGSLEVGVAIQELPDGKLLLLGNTQLNMVGIGGPFLIKLGSTGNILWKRHYEINGNYWASTMLPESDGVFLLGNNMLMKLNKQKNVLYCLALNNEAGIWLSSAASSSDGTYVVSGVTNPGTGGPIQLLVAKINKTDGAIKWSKSFWTGNYPDVTSLAMNSDGSFVVSGIKSTTSNHDCLLIKLDTNGKLLWKRRFGDNGQNSSIAILNAKDGGLALLGATPTKEEGKNDSVFLTLLDNNGKFPGCILSRSTPLAVTPFPAFQKNTLTYSIRSLNLQIATPAVTKGSVSVDDSEMCP